MKINQSKDIKTKIILVDDHPLFREGIKLLIELEGLGEVIGEADNGQVFLDLLNHQTPDMVIIDVDMPIMDGLQATIKARQTYPELKFLVLSMHGESNYYSSFIDAGAKGFVMKTADKHELETAIHKISMGDSFFSQELLLNIINDLKTPSKNQIVEPLIKLTDREITTLEFLCKGLSINEIAEKLFLSPKTIEVYRSNLLHKTETKNTLGLVLYAIKSGIVTNY